MQRRWLWLTILFVTLQGNLVGSSSVDCNNKGTLNPSTGKCQCLAYFDGDNCEGINCLNNGIPTDSADVPCVCPRGYQGQYCETRQEAPGAYRLFGIDKRKLAVFLNTPIDQVYRAYDVFSKAVVSEKTFVNGNYDSYYLYKFKNGQNIITGENPLSKQDFTAQLNDMNIEYLNADCEESALFSSVSAFIKSEKLSETVVSIFTQTPSTSDGYNDLVQLAIAFNLRINVYFAFSDLVCYNDVSTERRLQSLKDLAFSTGGLFLSYEKYNNASENLVSTFVQSTSNLQALAFTTSTTPTNLSLEVYPTSGNGQYYLTAEGSEVPITSNTHCILLNGQQYASTAVTRTVYSLYVDEPCQISVANATVIQIFRNGNIFGDVVGTGVQVYHTYADSINADASFIAPKEQLPMYPRIHIENLESNGLFFEVIGASLSSENGLLQSSNAVYRPHSTFEFALTENITCTNDGKFNWISVQLKVSNFSTTNQTYTETRYWPLLCMKPTSSQKVDVVAPQPESPVAEPGEVLDDSSPTSTKSSPVAACKNSIVRPSLVMAFSYQYPQHTRESFLRGPTAITSDFADSHFGNYLVFPFDVVNFNYAGSVKAETSFLPFKNDLNYFSSGGQSYEPTKGETNCLQALKDALTDNRVVSGSTVLLFVGKEAPVPGSEQSDVFEELLQLASTKQIRVIFLMDTTAYQGLADAEEALWEFEQSDHFAFYSQLAAVSNGHFVILNSITPSGSGTLSAQDVVANLLKNALAHKLALSRVFTYKGADVLNLGSVDLTHRQLPTSYFITASYAALPQFETTHLSYMIFSGKNGNVFAFPSSPDGNFVTTMSTGTATVGLQADLYQVSLSVLQVPENVTLIVRMWETLTDDIDYSIDVDFMRYESNTFKLENTYYGPTFDDSAAAVVNVVYPLEAYKQIRVDYFDCNGNVAATWDNYNELFLESKDTCNLKLYVNSFMCNFNQTCDVTSVDMSGFYTAKYTFIAPDGTLNEQYTSFWCAEGSDACPETGCGECLTPENPHHRGATCNVPDCSKNGHMQFDSSSNNYVCICNDGYIGEFCEEGTCTGSASFYTAIEPKYQTVTVGVVFRNRYNLEDISNALNGIQEIPMEERVLQYHLFISCYSGNYHTRYLGPSLSAFINAIKSLANVDPSLTGDCGDSQDVVDLADAVQYGLNAVGSSIRGMFWLAYAESSGVAVVLPNYYDTIQGYQQELFVVTRINAPVTSNFTDFVDAVRVTGGELFAVDSFSNGGLSNYFNDLLEHATSLNYYAPLSTSDVDVPTVNIEADSLLTVTNFAQNHTISSKPDGCEFVGTPSTYTQILLCRIADTSTISIHKSDSLKLPSYASVRVLDGLSPLWTLVNETRQDDLQAAPVVGTYPTLAFKAPDGVTVGALENPYYIRLVKRTTCNLDYTATLQKPLLSTGYNEYGLKFTKDGKEYSKHIPFVTTESIASKCQHGSTIDQDVPGAKCICGDLPWTGPFCSRPQCGDSGSLNPMQSACYCDMNHSGDTCQITRT